MGSVGFPYNLHAGDESEVDQLPDPVSLEMISIRSHPTDNVDPLVQLVHKSVPHLRTDNKIVTFSPSREGGKVVIFPSRDTAVSAQT
jgi:hypothetical protein